MENVYIELPAEVKLHIEKKALRKVMTFMESIEDVKESEDKINAWAKFLKNEVKENLSNMYFKDIKIKQLMGKLVRDAAPKNKS